VEAIESHFTDAHQHLLGDDNTVADAYLYTVANWTIPTGIGLDTWPNIAAYMERVFHRKTVQETFRAEGLV